MSSPSDPGPPGQDPNEPNPRQPNPYQQPGESNPYQQPYQQPGAAQANPYQQDPYQQDPYQQNPYQQPYGMTPYGGQSPQPHPQGTTVLVLGIVGLVFCGIAGIVGLVLGNRALKDIDANPAAYTNRQNVVVGRILSIVGLALWGLGIVFYVILAAVAFSGSAQ